MLSSRAEISYKYIRTKRLSTFITFSLQKCKKITCQGIFGLGRKAEELDSLSREIWFWCIDRHIHLSTAHVPGKDNHEADQELRSENDDTEWYFK